MTYVCITGNESNPEDLRRRIEKVLLTPAPLLAELRLDFLGLDPAECFRFLLSLPEDWSSRLVLTQRLSASGTVGQGKCRWPIPVWQNWWREVMQLRPWYAVDLDWLVVDELANESLSWPMEFRSKHVLFSLHASLDELEKRLPDLKASAELHRVGIKLASPVKGARDLARLARLRESIKHQPIHVVAAMGQAGRIWRWSRLAGDISYFVMDEAKSTAQGQDTLENVLPYLKQRSFPDLYMLWSTDPLNRRGETEWNRVFLRRGLQARYFNVPCASEDFDPGLTSTQKKAWAADALYWMEAAKIRGSSVTRPFKEVFPLLLNPLAPSSINTLVESEDSNWTSANTDGTGVLEILRERAVESVLLIGSGGTAQGLRAAFTRANLKHHMWKRGADGQLPTLALSWTPDAMVSTWPAEYQEILVQELERHKQSKNILPRICLDAQLKLDASESPLAAWCKKEGIDYIPGTLLWQRQARGQEKLWNLQKISPAAANSLQQHFPHSKSQTIRALWIALARGGITEIQNPGDANDVRVVQKIIAALGARISVRADLISVDATHPLRVPQGILQADDCGAALRMLLPWSCVLRDGQLQIQASPGLQKRPQDDFFQAVAMPWSRRWPIELNCGAKMPEQVSLANSSQFASGFLIAAAARIVRQEEKSITIKLKDGSHSFSFLKMTADFLRDAGFSVSLSPSAMTVSIEKALSPSWQVSIAHDAAALAYIQVIMDHLAWNFPLSWESLASQQGDAVFPQLLEQMRLGKTLSLSDCPDLAPPLWAAAMLERQILRIEKTPNLRIKESDRASALVAAAQALGAVAELKDDGFVVDARAWRVPTSIITLPVHEDHRLAMAYGLLQFFYPSISPSEGDCVAKSFPRFWDLLRELKGMVL